MNSSPSCTRRQLGALVASVFAADVQAQPASNRPLTLMVPYPAGGLSDVLARIVSPALSRQLKKTVIVDNLGGVSGAIAAQKVLHAPADGQLVFQGSPNELILSPMANPAVKFSSEDFRTVQALATSYVVFLARPDLPVHSVDDFIDYARHRAQQGQPITYGSVGNGSLNHLLGAYMAKRIGIDMTHVPYRGGAPAEQDLMGSQIDIFLTPYSKKYDDQRKAGHLKALALLNPRRVPGLLRYPAIGESKQLSDFHHLTWSAYFVKKETPQSVVVALHRAITAALSDPSVVAGLASNSQVVSQPLSLRQAEQTYAQAIAQFRGIAQALG